MSDALQPCKHPRIQTWRFEDTGEVSGLWSCVECGRKFEPASLTAPPAPAVPLTADQHFALREAHAIGASDAYFKVWPIHDNDAGRMLFERGFVRGFDSHARLVERAAPQAAPQPTQDGKPAP